jgi:hypothetical protein
LNFPSRNCLIAYGRRSRARCRRMGVSLQPGQLGNRRRTVRDSWVLRSVQRTASQGGPNEWFSANRWVRQDIGAGRWPFDDRSFDFVICSHTLEDVRRSSSPLRGTHPCGQDGDIEVLSRLVETCLGHGRLNQADLSHDRWLIEIDGRSRFCPSIIQFTAGARFVSSEVALNRSRG